jgi:hypothetical protein
VYWLALEYSKFADPTTWWFRLKMASRETLFAIANELAKALPGSLRSNWIEVFLAGTITRPPPTSDSIGSTHPGQWPLIEMHLNAWIDRIKNHGLGTEVLNMIDLYAFEPGTSASQNSSAIDPPPDHFSDATEDSMTRASLLSESVETSLKDRVTQHMVNAGADLVRRF